MMSEPKTETFADIDAEKIVLAALLHGTLRNGQVPPLDLFYYPPHKVIYDGLEGLRARKIPADIITLTQDLRERGELEKAGGAHAVTTLQTDYGKAPEIVAYELGRLREFHAMRQQRRLAQRMLNGDVEPQVAALELKKIAEGSQSETISDFTVRSAGEILELPRDEHANYFGDRLLALAQSLVIAGVGGIGKTRLLLQLLVAFIIGRPWCGIDTHAKSLRCLLIQTENGTARLQRDLEALKKWAAQDWTLVDENLLIHTLETEDDLLLHLSEPENVRRLEGTIRKLNPAIVSFDPLRDFAVGDLNSDADMSATLRELGRIARIGNPDRALVLLHHALTGRTGAAKAFGLERTGFARNSKLLQTWARGFINVVPGSEDNNETLVLTCGKNSNGKEFPPVAVRLNADTMIYEVDSDFDIESWRQQLISAKTKTGVRPQHLREILAKGRQYDKKQLAALIMEETGLGKSRAYQIIDEAKRGGTLHYNKMIKTYALT